jgi:hypothetical protein
MDVIICDVSSTYYRCSRGFITELFALEPPLLDKVAAGFLTDSRSRLSALPYSSMCDRSAVIIIFVSAERHLARPAILRVALHLVEGPPIHVPTNAATYYEIRFLSVDAAFVDFLRAKGILFREDDGAP